MTSRTIVSTAALGALLAGCASTGPTEELIDARRTYHQAVNSEAQRYVPAHVLAAKQALDRAELAHADEPGSYEERSLAYVAERKAQAAMAYGGYARAQQESLQAEARYESDVDRMRRHAQSELERTRNELSGVRQALSNVGNTVSGQAEQLKQRERELAARQAELEARQTELSHERQARQKAEADLAAALSSLREIAMVKEEARGMVITLSGEVLFATGRSGLLPIARQRLQQVAEALKELGPDKLIVIEGHTDSRGSDHMNMQLSESRAESVRQFLASQGIEPSRLQAVGQGESRPIADNSSPEGRANNRRVEIIIQNQRPVIR